MELLFKSSRNEDIPFYAQLLRNADWLKMAGFSIGEFVRDEQIEKYLKCYSPFDLKQVVLLKSNFDRIGFCHFKLLKCNNYTVEYFGGLKFDLIGKGFGLYAAVLAINNYFSTYDEIKCIQAVVLKSNHFSIRLDESIGFLKIGEKIINYSYYNVYELSKTDFFKMPIVTMVLNKHLNISPSFGMHTKLAKKLTF